MLTARTKWIVVTGLAMMAGGALLTPVAGLSAASTGLMVAGIGVCSGWLLLEARRGPNRGVGLALGIATAFAGLLLLVPNRPRGLLVVPAVMIVAVLVIFWRQL